MFSSMKFSQLSVLIIWISLTILVQNGVVSSIDIMMTGPDISIGGWMESDFESREWHTNSSPPLGNSPYHDAIVVPSSIRGLSLVCNASFPVEWRFHRERWGGHSRLQYALQTTVVAEGLEIKRFSSELSFLSFDSNSVSGNYTCQKVGYPGLSQSLYVFWEGGSPPFLTLARSYRRPPNIPFRNDSANFVLPCTVSHPEVVPRLMKEVGNTEEVIRKNGSVQYDPRVGFTMTNLPNPYGRYTCQGGEAEDDNEGDGDTVTFNVIDADDGPKPEFNETIKHGAFYSINSTSRELTCCSAGQKPPKLKLVECMHPTICAVAKHTLHVMESAKKTELGCSMIQLRTLRAGVFRCVGAGIDVVREYFYPMPETAGRWGWGGNRKGGGKKGWKPRHWNKNTEDKKDDDKNNNNNNKDDDNKDDSVVVTPGSKPVDDPYFDWNEGDRQKMMRVTKLNDPLYIGQNRSFVCRVSHYYYAQGLVWSLTYANQSEQFFQGRDAKNEYPFHHPGAGIRHFEILLGKNEQYLDLQITADLQNITCHAPVWNASEWGHKAIRFVVKMPTAPSLVGNTHTEYSWYLNDTKKSLECKYSGEPMPKVLWKKGNATFSLNTNTANGTSTVTVPRVSLDNDDVYECIISNPAGTISKTFRVTVSHSTSSTVSAILILSIVGFIIVSIVAGFMYKYLKSQSTVINHLANLAFKDVTGNGDSSNPNNTSSTGTNRSAISVNTNGVILPSISSPSAPISPATTASTKDHFGSSNGGGGHANSGFIFDYSNANPSEQDSHHRDGSSPQPPLSSFSSYHKF